jgi:hypothetical protein
MHSVSECSCRTTGEYFYGQITLIRITKYSPFRWTRYLWRGPVAAHLLGLRVRIPPRAWMSVSCEYCGLSGRGLCNGPIPRPEESYRVRGVCDLETSKNWPRPECGFVPQEKETNMPMSKVERVRK